MTVTIENLRETYVNTLAKLERIDFEKLWPGFTAFPFALYNDEFVYFKDEEIPWDDRFRGNTSIEIDGEYVAIWNMNYLEYNELDFLAYNLIHEMFHCFQFEQGETRFPNDLRLLKQPEDLKFYGMKTKENEMLCRAIEETGNKRREYFYKYAGMYKKRRELFPEITFEEELAQTLEGLAEYVGMKALYQLSPDIYERQIMTYIDLVLDRDMIFNNRILAFFTGTFICLIADDLGIQWDRTINNQTHTIFDLIFSTVDTIDYNIEISERLELKYKQYTETTLNNINEVAEKGSKVVLDQAAIIKHYDPMNLVRYQDEIYSRHFVKLEVNSKLITLEGETVLNLLPNSFNEVESYTIIK